MTEWKGYKDVLISAFKQCEYKTNSEKEGISNKVTQSINLVVFVGYKLFWF